MRLFTLLDRYIMRQYFVTFFFTITLFMAISIIFDMTEKVDDFIEHGAPTSAIIFDYYINFVPYFANLFSSLFIFIAVIYFTSRLAYRSEIIAILSAGVSFWRLLRPYMICSLVLAIGSFILTGYVLPPANKTRLEFENRYINGQYVNVARNIHLRVSPKSYAYMESFSLADSTGFKFSLEQFNDSGRMVSKLLADRIVWKAAKQTWRIEGGYRRFINGQNESLHFLTSIDTTLPFSPKDFDRPNLDVSNMSNPELTAYIQLREGRGEEGVEFFRVKYAERFAIPFSVFILTIIAVSLSSRRARGGIGLQIGIGIIISFLYILLMQFTTVFSRQGGFPPLLGAWTPNLIFGTVAAYLAIRAPK